MNTALTGYHSPLLLGARQEKIGLSYHPGES